MTKFISGLGLVFISLTAGATTAGFDLKMDYSLNGKHVASPHMTTKSGQAAMVTQESKEKMTYLQVTPTDDKVVEGKHTIRMKFEVGTIAKDGTKTVLGRPEIIALENERAEISVSDEVGNEQVDIAVTAARTKL